MADIFDATRRKISKHITTNIVPDVLKEKNPEFKEKAKIAADEYLASDKFKRAVANQLEYAALDMIRSYFNSTEFRKKCREVAKGMVK